MKTEEFWIKSFSEIYTFFGAGYTYSARTFIWNAYYTPWSSEILKKNTTATIHACTTLVMPGLYNAMYIAN